MALQRPFWHDLILSREVRSRQSTFTGARIMGAMKEDDCSVGLSVMTDVETDSAASLPLG